MATAAGLTKDAEKAIAATPAAEESELDAAAREELEKLDAKQGLES